MYEIDPERLDLAHEFKARVYGRHSGELQRVLNRMRGGVNAGRYVILCTKRHREWVLARMGEMEGTLILEWEVVPGATTYVIECSPNVLPRVFEQVKIATRTDYTAEGLTSGQRYVFRVAAVGPLGQGPWSDEATKMAP